MNQEVAEAILALGRFTLTETQPHRWERIIPEEAVSVTAYTYGDHLEIALSPSISSLQQHHDKRIAAGVMYEIAAKYAEKVNGQIVQTSINVPECMSGIGMPEQHIIAQYPDQPLNFERVCPGFQQVLLGLP